MATGPKLGDFPSDFQTAYRGILPRSITRVTENRLGGGQRSEAFGIAIERLIESIQNLPEGRQEAAVTLLRAFDKRYGSTCFIAGYYSMDVVRAVENALKKVA